MIQQLKYGLAVALLFFAASPVFAQYPALEFSSSGGPAGAGPSTSNQIVTLQNNIDNPTGNTFFSSAPTTTVTFSLTNQQRSSSDSFPSAGVVFGGNSNGSNDPGIYQLYNLLSNNTLSSSSQYTSANPTAGTGMETASNYCIPIYVSTRPLYKVSAPLPPINGKIRYQYADLVITFNRAINNPIIHLSGLGANTVTLMGLGVSTDFELLTSGATLTRLSGTTAFTVPTSTTIINGSSQYFAQGTNTATGSVRVNGTNLTSVTFRMYLSGQDDPTIAGAPTAWNASTTGQTGDLISISVSISTCNAGVEAPSLSGTSLSKICAGSTVNLNSLHNGTVPTGSSLVWFTNSTHTGTAYATPTAATAGTYYAFYYDSTGSCYSQASSAVTVTIGTTPSLSGTSLSNVCPGTTVNLNSLHNGTIPSGGSLVWFNNSAHTGTAIADPTTVGTSGTYYAFYYDTTNLCYSSASSAVTVNIAVCCTAGNTAPIIH